MTRGSQSPEGNRLFGGVQAVTLSGRGSVWVGGGRQEVMILTRVSVLVVKHDFSPTIPVADIVAEAWKYEASKCSKKDRSSHGAGRL